ncbi:hypothetical protein LTR17_023734 [Elasticomyces elasticus]|nr:hypothetical protein LTR17_023734 [Elasticomyces elasticus]
MCRWFAYLSPTEPSLLEDTLINPANSLSRQVHDHYLPQLISHDPKDLKDADHLTTARNSIYNIDGLGVAWYTTSYADSELKNTGQSSDGQQAEGLWPAVYKTEMSEAAFGAINGGTDSEHLAALYLTYLTKNGGPETFATTYSIEEMEKAMHMTVATLIATQKRILGPKAAPNSLNLCATDGTRLIAYRFRNHATQQPPSLYYSTKAGTTLNRKYPDHPDGKDVPGRMEGRDVGEHGKHLIVASEPSTYIAEEWVLVGKNQVILADPRTKTFEVRDMRYEEGWDVEDPMAV